MPEVEEAVPAGAQQFEEQPQPGQEVAIADSRGVISAFASENNFKAAQRMAKALMAATMVPQAYRESVPNTLIAMELANRIGASVFMVMQNLDVIHGVPGWRAKFLIATVNTCGRFSTMKFRWKGEEGKPGWECRAYAKELSTGEECVGPKVTMEIAVAEGWATKAGSKWKTLPELMMTYRAGAFWTRVYAPELSLGMLSSEEVADITPDAELPKSIAPGTPITEVVGGAAAKFLEKIQATPASTASDPPHQQPVEVLPLAVPVVVRGAPTKCKGPCGGKNKLTTAEKEFGLCSECRLAMTQKLREEQGTAVPPPVEREATSSDEKVSRLVALSTKARDTFLASNNGDMVAANKALEALSEGAVKNFSALSLYMEKHPEFEQIIEESIGGGE